MRELPDGLHQVLVAAAIIRHKVAKGRDNLKRVGIVQLLELRNSYM